MDKLEILSTELLDKHPDVVDEFRTLATYLKNKLGWHYLLDFSWAVNQIDFDQTKTALDAGAAMGLMQWWLSEHGVDVISVDRVDRKNIAPQFHKRFRIQGLRPEDLDPKTPSTSPQPQDESLKSAARGWRNRLTNLFASGTATPATDSSTATLSHEQHNGGVVFMYNQDLLQMVDVKDNSVDMVISISSLEHNSPENLAKVVKELMRVLKPGGKIVATLGCSRDQDWYHEPSKGWCYTEATLREVFELEPGCPSNYDRFDELMENLRNCAELRDNLAPFYSKSGNNGMPWGVWDPKYQSVGVVKVKQ